MATTTTVSIAYTSLRRHSSSVSVLVLLFPRSPRWCEHNLVWGGLEQFLSHGSETSVEEVLIQFILHIVRQVSIFNSAVIKRVWPVSWVHFFSTKPVCQIPPRSCQTLGQTLLVTNDAEKHKIQLCSKSKTLFNLLYSQSSFITYLQPGSVHIFRQPVPPPSGYNEHFIRINLKRVEKQFGLIPPSET